jgi:threonine dehydrogenase-like Zn-dependent dehydrogenase
MKALIKKHNQDPNITDVTCPKIGENYVLIKVDLSGICKTDIYIAKNMLVHKNGVIIGHECSGHIVALKKTTCIKEGDYVTVDPICGKSIMMGINFNGCFAEYVKAPLSRIYKVGLIKNRKLAAYIEPIAHSLAPLKSRTIKKEHRGAIFGKDRIGMAIFKIMRNEGYADTHLINDELDIQESYFDFIIETAASKESLKKIIKALKPKGLLILKSRYPLDVAINIYALVKKEIRIEGLYCHNFSYAIEYALSYPSLFEPLFGDVYPLEEWEEAFIASSTAYKKIFLEPDPKNK